MPEPTLEEVQEYDEKNLAYAQAYHEWAVNYDPNGENPNKPLPPKPPRWDGQWQEE